MTDADKQGFATIMAGLAVTLREPNPDVVLLRAYFEALKDCDVEFLAMAASRLANEARFFPKVSELRVTAATIERERRRAQLELLRRLPEPLCSACSDTGWRATDVALVQRVARRDGGQGFTEVPIKASAPMRRCDCVGLRRLELLGRRPWPALPEGTPTAGNAGELTQAESVAALTRLGVTHLRVMPKVRRVADPEFEEATRERSGSY